MDPMLCHGRQEDARLAHWKFYTVAEKDPEYMDRYSIAMERLKMAIPYGLLMLQCTDSGAHTGFSSCDSQTPEHGLDS